MGIKLLIQAQNLSPVSFITKRYIVECTRQKAARDLLEDAALTCKSFRFHCKFRFTNCWAKF